MVDANLVLKFRLAGSNEERVKAVDRIRLDGQGLTIYDAQTGRSQTIETRSLESLKIVNVPRFNRTPVFAIAG